MKSTETIGDHFTVFAQTKYSILLVRTIHVINASSTLHISKRLPNMFDNTYRQFRNFDPPCQTCKRY